MEYARRMKYFVSTEPDSDPAVQRLIVQSWLRKSHGWAAARLNRERAVEGIAAMLFIAAATAMAVLIDAGPTLDPALAIALVAAYALAARVEFHTGSGFTSPTQLVFVPMLFLLPIGIVPLLVACGLIASRVPEYVAGSARTDGIVIAIGDSWHAVWPVLVLGLTGATTPELADWPIYVAALAAQFSCDFITTSLRVYLGQGIPLRMLARELGSIYLADAMLAPIGLLAAFASASEPWAFLMVLPLIGLIAIFAREREARIENALTLSSAYRGTAHLLGELLSSSHEYTGEHSRSVVVLAHEVGIEMELDERTLRDVEFGALLHDVGKLSVPNQLINKPGSLSEEEWSVMKRHTVEGEEMLERIGGLLGDVGAVVRSHHERFDGTGYPDGLCRWEIPLAARVISACDSYNAMTTDRPYRAAMTRPEAIAELRRNAGTQFDPEVVAALVAVVEHWGAEEAPAPPSRQPASIAASSIEEAEYAMPTSDVMKSSRLSS